MVGSRLVVTMRLLLTMLFFFFFFFLLFFLVVLFKEVFVMVCYSCCDSCESIQTLIESIECSVKHFFYELDERTDLLCWEA